MSETRRRAERKSINQPIVLKADWPGKVSTYDAAIVDISPYGVRIQTPVDLAPGEVVEYCSPNDLEHSVPCLVKWMGRKDTDLGGIAGLEFLTAPVKGG